MAERVISHFNKDRIIFNQVSKEKPLNQFFQEMIEGTITEDDLGNLLHGKILDTVVLLSNSTRLSEDLLFASPQVD